MSELERLARYLGPSPFADDQVLLARAHLPDLPDDLLASRSIQLQRMYGLERRSSPTDPRASALDTVAALARALLNRKRGLVTACGARIGSDARVWVGYHAAPLGWQALGLAWSAVVHGATETDAWRDGLAELDVGCERGHPDYQARVLMIGARDAGIPVLEVSGPARVWQFGWGSRRQWYFETSSDGDGAIGQRIASLKPLTTAALGAIGIPVPRHVQLADPDALPHALERIGFPCVVKPQDRGGGKGVTTGIMTEEAARAAFNEARSQSSAPILLEQQVEGSDYRVLVVDGAVKAVIERRPPEVTGDGIRTVRELIEALNAQRRGGMQNSMYLVPVALGEAVIRTLATQGATLDTRPGRGQVLRLLTASNRSTGGTCHDRMPDAHPRVKEVCVRIAAALGLRCTGLDLVTPDISRPLEKAGGVVLEANLTPGTGPMIAAGASEAKVGRMILGNAPGRIPVALIVAPDDAHPTLARALLDAFADAGLRIAAPDRVLDRTGALPLEDPEPGTSIRAALMDRTATAVVVLRTPFEIQRSGLPVDRMELALLPDGALAREWVGCVRRHADRVSSLGAPEDAANMVRAALASTR